VLHQHARRLLELERQAERANFMNDVQAAMRSSKLWANRR